MSISFYNSNPIDFEVYECCEALKDIQGSQDSIAPISVNLLSFRPYSSFLTDVPEYECCEALRDVVVPLQRVNLSSPALSTAIKVSELIEQSAVKSLSTSIESSPIIRKAESPSISDIESSPRGESAITVENKLEVKAQNNEEIENLAVNYRDFHLEYINGTMESPTIIVKSISVHTLLSTQIEILWALNKKNDIPQLQAFNRNAMRELVTLQLSLKARIDEAGTTLDAMKKNVVDHPQLKNYQQKCGSFLKVAETFSDTCTIVRKESLSFKEKLMICAPTEHDYNTARIQTTGMTLALQQGLASLRVALSNIMASYEGLLKLL